MPIYHLSLQTISRSDGRSACATAAYRAGEPIVDHSRGVRYDFPHRSDRVQRTQLIGWSGTRSDLWNAAEASEKRKNSRVAREINASLPRELAPPAQWDLAMAFAELLHSRYGVAVDLALHDAADGNPHLHAQFTTRQVLHDEFGKKTRVLDEKQTGPQEIEILRAHWAQLLNDALAEIGTDERVDHRSLKRQGNDRTPKHLPRAARALEDRGIISVAGAKLRAALRADWALTIRAGLHEVRRRSVAKLRVMIHRAVRSTYDSPSLDSHLEASKRRHLAIVDELGDASPDDRRERQGLTGSEKGPDSGAPRLVGPARRGT